jgi:rhamnogalacturonan endolyase
MTALTVSLQAANSQKPNANVKCSLDADHRGATISNGLITLHIASNGNVNSVRYNDGEMVQPGKGGNVYFSYVADSTKNGRLNADTAVIMRQADDIAEIVYRQNSFVDHLQWEVGYIVRKGVSGYYTYATVKADGINGLREARIVHRLNPQTFNYAWVSDDNQGPQPSTTMLKTPARKIQDATFLLSDSTIYTKYDYCNYVKDDALHGMMGDAVGAWLITPSFEWVNGGVGKQELTVHGDDKSPLILQMFQSQHFGAGTTYIKEGEQKMYGPALVYFNNGTHDTMIADAKRQTSQELSAWPWQWMQHDAFPVKRGSVKGRIMLGKEFRTTRLQVVLAEPGSDPRHQGAGYQFWCETDETGNFTIENVRPGNYALYAWALNGEATGLFEHDGISVKSGNNNVGTLNWDMQKYGKTLWCIGESDGRSAGFCLSDHKRQYGMFNEVPADLTYTIGKSYPDKDWYYAQTQNGRWNIVFNSEATYTQPLLLTIAVAGAANQTRAEVIINGQRIGVVKTKNDSGIYRSAMQSGQPTLFTFDIQPEVLRKGKNTLSLKVSNIKHVGGIMYDCIMLEEK